MTWIVTAIFIIFFLVSCHYGEFFGHRPGSEFEPFESKETKPTSLPKSEEIFDIVDRLMENPLFTVVGVESILGPMDLQRSSSSNPHFNTLVDIYEAQCEGSD